VPTYGYECLPCGGFQVVRPMAEATETASCPECGGDARRTFGSPGLRTLDPGLRRALDASASSAENPAVVSGVPGRSRRPTPVTRDPRHAKLPRP
jgi:putative FmdB family regulatory protein